MNMELRAYDAEESCLLWVRWDQEHTQFQSDNPWMRQSIVRWEQLGLLELVGLPDDLQQRLTPSRDPQFLPRLAEYLRVQGGFDVRLERLDFLVAPFLREHDAERFVRRLRAQLSSNNDSHTMTSDLGPMRPPRRNTHRKGLSDEYHR